MFDDSPKVETTNGTTAEITDKKTQIKSELREAQDAFYKGGYAEEHSQ